MAANLHSSVTVNIFEAKTQLSRLIERVEKGEEVVIARAGKPVARLTQLDSQKPKVRFGGLKGKIWIADDFDAPLPDEILAEFEEGPVFPPERQPRDRTSRPDDRAKAD